jgi:hypothetical protein
MKLYIQREMRLISLDAFQSVLGNYHIWTDGRAIQSLLRSYLSGAFLCTRHI